MTAMSLSRTCNEHRRDALPCEQACPAPARPVRRAMLHALSMMGLGMGGVAAIDDDEALSIV